MAEPTAELSRAWHRALASVQAQLAGPAYDLWIGDIAPLGYRNGVVQLQVPNAFVLELMTRQYAGDLRQALSNSLGEAVDLEFVVGDAPSHSARLRPAPPPDATLFGSDEQAASDSDFATSPLNPKFTFDSFVVGPSNRFPHAAAQAVARNPAKSYNPLFLYGGVGLGKTHLMQAIGFRIRELHPELNVVCVTGETFLFHFVSAIREDRTGDFRRCYRNVDVWLVDDIQFIASRERTRTEAEFFHTFNALHETNKQIVITSDRPPKELLIDDRLRSRFEWGLITDIKPPDVETRLAILQKRAAEDRLLVSGEVLMYIAQVVRDSIRALEGALVKVVATASLLNEEVTLDLVRDCLKEYSTGERPMDVTTESIHEAVARHYGIDAAALAGKSRRQDVVLARQVAMYLSREIVKSSFADIGVHFDRDHSTVMYACSKIAELLDQHDDDVTAAVKAITERVELYGG